MALRSTSHPEWRGWEADHNAIERSPNRPPKASRTHGRSEQRSAATVTRTSSAAEFRGDYPLNHSEECFP